MSDPAREYMRLLRYWMRHPDDGSKDWRNVRDASCAMYFRLTSEQHWAALRLLNQEESAHVA